MSKNFIYKNEDFYCQNCGRFVPKGKGFIRDHCPFCLFGLHVDITPGDRKEVCHGLLKPIAYEYKGGELILKFKCLKCGKIVYNKAAPDDNFNAIISL